MTGGAVMVKNLRLLREENGISQQKLGDMLNITQQAIYKYEHSSSEPDIATLIKIADIFGVTVDYLIGNSDIKEKNTDTVAVILTETEHNHIKLWRRLSDDIKEKTDQLIESIIRTKLM